MLRGLDSTWRVILILFFRSIEYIEERKPRISSVSMSSAPILSLFLACLELMQGRSFCCLKIVNPRVDRSQLFSSNLD